MIKQEGTEVSPLGGEFRKFRELRGWTVEAAAKVTKIRADQLQDLENDNYAHFPSVACVRGFVRIYAKALGLDERRMVARLDGRISEFGTERKPLDAIEKLPTPVVTKIKEPTTRSVGGNLMAIVAVMVIFIIAWVAWKTGMVGPPPTEAPPPRAELAQAGSATGNPAAAKPAPAAARTQSAVRPETPPSGRPPETAAMPPVERPIPAAPAVSVAVPVAAPVSGGVPPAAVPVGPVAAVPAAPVATPLGAVATPMAGLTAEPTVENIPRAEPVQTSVRLQLVAEEEAFVKVVVNGNEEEPLFDGIVGARQTINCEGQRVYIKVRPASALVVSQNGGAPSRLSTDSGVQEFVFPR
jgi:cytoskeleton protein RodZ